MPRLLHQLIVPEQAISADGVQTFTLSVNPLSVLLLTLRPLNDTGTLSNFQNYLGVCGALNRVNISLLGSSLVNMTGRDLAALAYFRHGVMYPQATLEDTNNDRRATVLPVFASRFPYDPNGCYPASKRGELVLEIDFDVDDTGYDGMRFSCESIEILETNPKEYERKVQISDSFTASADNDLDLPVGNLVRGALLFGTTGVTGGSPAPTWGRIETHVDNEQKLYASTDFEVAHGLHSLMGRQPPMFDAHTHRVDASACGGANEESGGPIVTGSGGWGNYAFLDFDPTRDDTFAIDTGKHTRLHLRSAAEATDAVRAVAIERIKA